MSDLQPKGPKIELGGEERELLFTLRAVDEIQDRFKKPVSEIVAMLGNAEGIYEVLPFLTAALVTEGERKRDREPVTEDDVKGWVTVPMLSEVSRAILRSYGIAIPESDEDNDPNATSRSS